MMPPTHDERVQEAITASGLHDVEHVTLLTGGMVNAVFLLTRSHHDPLVLKTNADAPDTLFAIEAEGLQALREQGQARTPDILGVQSRWLLMEAHLPALPDDRALWERAGRALATLHSTPGERFGWDHDGWLGMLPQRNAWQENGHQFFAEERILRYLPEPRVQALLTKQDRQAIESLCQQLPNIVPAMPATLTHGDFWPNNLVASRLGEPVLIDPAVSWMWPEVDLGMMYYVTNAVPEFAQSAIPRLFDAYQEIKPLNAGWQERAPIMFLRELLSMLAHEGDIWECVSKIRDVIRPFRPAT